MSSFLIRFMFPFPNALHTWFAVTIYTSISFESWLNTFQLRLSFKLWSGHVRLQDHSIWTRTCRKIRASSYLIIYNRWQSSGPSSNIIIDSIWNHVRQRLIVSLLEEMNCPRKLSSRTKLIHACSKNKWSLYEAKEMYMYEPKSYDSYMSEHNVSYVI